MLCSFITGKQRQDSEIVSNVINERNYDKVKSFEDVNINKKK